LGQPDTLANLCAEAGFDCIQQNRMSAVLRHDTDQEACDAAFVGGPAALAWSRFDQVTRARVRGLYLASIARWAVKEGYRIPVEFVTVTAAITA
jgi:hypothetical protein